jgi:hypothetical protein
MLDRKLQSWFYPEPTGDVGRDRNARTLQITCLLFAFAIALVAVLDTIARRAGRIANTGYGGGRLSCGGGHESCGYVGVGRTDRHLGCAVDRNSAGSGSA